MIIENSETVVNTAETEPVWDMHDHVLTACRWGGFIGDICGSVHEFDGFKTDDPRSIELINPDCDFTDDSILLRATEQSCYLRGFNHADRFIHFYREYGELFPKPKGGYGARFREWLRHPEMGPYNSYGNGSATRAAVIGVFTDSMRETLEASERSASVSHNHPEGVKGAQAVAAAVYLVGGCGHGGRKRGEQRAREGLAADKDGMRRYVESTFGYDLSRRIADIRPGNRYDESCQETVPVALTAFLESVDFRHAIQLALSVGGDADSIACIAGAVAGAYYRRIPEDLFQFAFGKVNGRLGDYYDDGRDTCRYVWDRFE